MIIPFVDNTPTIVNDSMNSSQISTSQKKLKARRAFIADGNEETAKASKKSSSTEKTKDIMQSLSGNKDHLETKKQIENLRKQYGDSWLNSQGASSMVHDVIGIPTPQPDASAGNLFRTNGPPETTEQLIENFFGNTRSYQRTSTPVDNQGQQNEKQLPFDVSYDAFHFLFFFKF